MRTALVPLLLLAPMAAPAADLAGTVRGPAGKPVAGATVFVRTAAPRVGVGVL